MNYSNIYPIPGPSRRTGLGDAVPGGDSNAGYTGFDETNAASLVQTVARAGNSNATFWEVVAAVIAVAFFLSEG